jgi:acyl-coenzyme A synthetase/AMP-(fatty) acid ligase
VDGIKNCACIYDKEKELIVLIYEGKVKNAEKILNGIMNKVPSYMYPDKILRIKEMPKNSNGKIDRKYLSANYKTLN